MRLLSLTLECAQILEECIFLDGLILKVSLGLDKIWEIDFISLHRDKGPSLTFICLDCWQYKKSKCHNCLLLSLSPCAALSLTSYWAGKISNTASLELFSLRFSNGVSASVHWKPKLWRRSLHEEGSRRRSSIAASQLSPHFKLYIFSITSNKAQSFAWLCLEYVIAAAAVCQTGWYIPSLRTWSAADLTIRICQTPTYNQFQCKNLARFKKEIPTLPQVRRDLVHAILSRLIFHLSVCDTQILSAADLTIRISTSNVRTGKRRVGLCAGFKWYGAMILRGVVKF